MERIHFSRFDAIPVDEKEESFPRGGKQLLTPLERSIIKAQVERDLLFDEVSDIAITEEEVCIIVL